MKKSFFHCARQIVLAEKYFEISRREIEFRLASKGEFELTTEHDVTDDDGTVSTTVLRLNIATKSDYVHCWQVSLKLHQIRIDGIDYETTYKMLDGTRGRGWHRHNWNEAHDNADRDKRPLEHFDDVTNRKDFLIRAFSAMRITLNKNDDGSTPELQFD